MEIELKYRLLNHKELSKKLDSIGKKQSQTQIDVYYNPPHKDFLKSNPIKEWIRIRTTKNGATLTYKKFHEGSNVISCDEHETTVDPSIKEIFSALGFRKIVTVEKKRTSWMYDSVEISIDEVKGLGAYLELEEKGEANIMQAKKHLTSVLKKIGAKVASQEFEGYPYLLLKKKGGLSKNKLSRKVGF